MDKFFLDDKNTVSFYWPLTVDSLNMDKEFICLKYLDLIDSYLNPLQFGLTKDDVKDFFNEKKFTNLSDFLRYKGYVTTDDDIIDFFISLYERYEINIVPCYKITFLNLENTGIDFVGDLVNISISFIDKEIQILLKNIIIKSGIFDFKSKSFLEKE